ncbi:hypothetical protein CKO25_04705 [Thiocapsa imhoffii]|uniref:Type II secretion system protein GspB C-terminal domain-containing protein n=1 Tax=Thiocapsa imhoffii TaxID=382777 RepID=A0A9X1B7L6_9GAMM|nr:general secretion pathway protein GspB [Thiocapsa imhoffii]MBK1643969.1 hypothetical protein [Thiocapsa imhoffii]
MSYILEALKKSQQERELGRVPTLDTSGLFSEDTEPATNPRWGLVAVGLAGVAVVIALYAALRPTAPLPEAEPRWANSATGVDDLVLVAPINPGDVASMVWPAEQAPWGGTGQGDRAPPDSALPLASPRGPSGVSPEVAGSAATPPRPSASLRPGQAEVDIIDDEAMAFESVLDPWLERELLRELEAEPAGVAAPPVPPPPARRPQRAAVPEDLIEDIESFKQQLRREQGIPPPQSQRQPATISGDPTKLRLTPLQQAQVPAYFMTAHVYDTDPAKRFVLINALRYVEGEETRDGLRVERIIPEGAVLSYLGNPFFVRR